MKDWKVMKLRRISNDLNKALQGCPSSKCVLRRKQELDGLPANPCSCMEDVRNIRRQLDKELILERM